MTPGPLAFASLPDSDPYSVGVCAGVREPSIFGISSFAPRLPAGWRHWADKHSRGVRSFNFSAGSESCTHGCHTGDHTSPR